MKILITGADGQLGWQFKKVFAKGNEILATDRDVMDITDEAKVREVMEKYKPEIVLHGAAYTQVDKAEEEPELAFKINELGTRNVAEQAKKLGALMVYISTDFVFDGAKKSPYNEKDATNSLNIYGKSKLAGEEAVKKSGVNFIIARTAWLYGENGKNFIKTILGAADEKPELKVVDDQIGSPTYTKDLATAIDGLIKKGERGIYHVVNSGQCSWFELAKEALKLKGKTTPVEPINSDQLDRAAKRPPYTVLDNAKLAGVGIEMRPWQEALAEYIEFKGES